MIMRKIDILSGLRRWFKPTTKQLIEKYYDAQLQHDFEKVKKLRNQIAKQKRNERQARQGN